MNSNKFPVGFRIFFLTTIIMGLVVAGINVSCKWGGKSKSGNAASISKGQGSSGTIGHKTWTQYGGSGDQSKFVDLQQISKKNVQQLQVSWTYPTKDNLSSYRFNPIVVDNVMYVLAKNNSLVALDVTTGKEIWIHANLNTTSKRESIIGKVRIERNVVYYFA
jgi:glucose dehydrogenase